MSGFDERCPYCDHKLEDLRHDWEGSDYDAEFVVECEGCRKAVNVIVHQVPEFQTTKNMCRVCQSAEVHDVRTHYCEPCKVKLQQLSDHNERVR